MGDGQWTMDNGTKGQWNNKTKEQKNNITMEKWNNGTMERDNRTMEQWNNGTMEQLDISVGLQLQLLELLSEFGFGKSLFWRLF